MAQHPDKLDSLFGQPIYAYTRENVNPYLSVARGELDAIITPEDTRSTIVSALPQQHERGLGGWQAEAPVLAELFQLTHGALTAMVTVIEGLEVDEGRMTANLAAAQVGTDTGESEALVAQALAAYEKDR